MAGQIALSVSVKVQPAYATAARHWIFPNCGVHGTALPLDVAWKTDIH
jgi:hypothetical protein